MYKVTKKDLKRWRTMSEVITENDTQTSDEILSRVIEKLDFNAPIKNLDGFVFISLRNCFYNMKESERVERKRFKRFETKYKENNSELEDEYDVKSDLVRQEKLELISKCYDKVFDTFEKQLYYIYFIKGLSERDIASQSGITRYTIRLKIAEIKNKIKEYVTKNSKQ